VDVVPIGVLTRRTRHRLTRRRTRDHNRRSLGNTAKGTRCRRGALSERRLRSHGSGQPGQYTTRGHRVGTK
jgi:hypothetical protein